MSTVVTALFPNAETANAALAKVGDVAREAGPPSAMVHSGHLREEEVPLSGTDALRGATMGALLVGGVGALVGCLVVWPSMGFWFGMQAMFAMFIGGSLFGIVAGAVAGASEANHSIRSRASKVREGQSLLTCEVEDDDVEATCGVLLEAGGERVEAA